MTSFLFRWPTRLGGPLIANFTLADVGIHGVRQLMPHPSTVHIVKMACIKVAIYLHVYPPFAHRAMHHAGHQLVQYLRADAGLGRSDALGYVPWNALAPS